MICPACRKKVLFDVVGDDWSKLHDGTWLHGGPPPPRGALGDCPACGVRLAWEEGEEPGADEATPPRVHLSAIRATPRRFAGRELSLRALLLSIDGRALLCESWRLRPKGGPAEHDAALVARLLRENRPPLTARFADDAMAERVGAVAKRLALPESPAAAWIEADGRFETRGRAGTLTIQRLRSVWPAD